MHVKCRQADQAKLGVCADCGADLQSAAATEAERWQEAAALQKDVKNYHLTTGTGRIVVGGICLLTAGLLLPCLLRASIFGFIAIGAVGVAGVGLISAGLAQLRAARRGEFTRDSDAQDLADRD